MVAGNYVLFVGINYTSMSKPNKRICDRCKKEIDSTEKAERKVVGFLFCKPFEEMTDEDWDNFDNLPIEEIYE